MFAILTTTQNCNLFLGKQNKINIAVSNPCFEVWLFLHLGEIIIENDYVEFCDLNNKKLLKVEKSKVIDRKLSKKICNILGELRQKESRSGYDIYLNSIDNAISRSKNNLRKIKKDNLLVGNEYIGQTYVSKLISKILNQN